MSVIKGKKQQIKNQIVTLLTKESVGLTQFKISENVQVARQTIKKYLDELQTEGKIQAAEIGAYTLYTLPKDPNRDHLFSQMLYYGALRVSAYLTKSHEWLNPELIEIAWGGIIDQISIPFEEEIPRLEKKPTPDLLERLLNVVCKLINSLKIFNLHPNAGILPPLGTQSPMTRLIRVEDPGLKESGSVQHYYLIAGLLQEKLTYRSGMPIIVRVAREIQSDDTEFYYEVGFVEQYYLDTSIVEQQDTNVDPHTYLDVIQKWFSTFLKCTTREYFLGNTLHYELRFADNLQFEEFWAVRARSLLKNLEIFQKYSLKATRKFIAYEDWPDNPFLIVQLITNVGFTLDEYRRAARKVYPYAGYNVFLESIPNGLKISMLEPFDFEATWVIHIDENSIREHYHKIGITSEEYLKERQRALQEILEEANKKQIQRAAKKRKVKRQQVTNQ
jgi:hypothetical protein